MQQKSIHVAPQYALGSMATAYSGCMRGEGNGSIPLQSWCATQAQRSKLQHLPNKTLQYDLQHGR